MILVLNCGSQSIKWKLFDPSPLTKGEGFDSNLKVRKEGRVDVFEKRNYEKILLGELGKLEKYKKEIKKIGHRVVHGGERFKKPLVVTKNNLKSIEKLNRLAPLHNPFNVLGIKFSQSVFPDAKQIAVFDTEFFSALPEKAYTYPLPEKIRRKYKIKRFGFHGISHEYAAKQGAGIIGRDFNNLKIITCHLGGGASITAIDKGKAVDTSMGFTPLEGLVMMTRSGSIDPGIVLYLNSKMKNLDFVLNNESGVRGICGLSDMKDVLKAAKKGNKKAKLALDIFVYSIQKYIGAYFAILGGCDLLVFTGAIGAGSAKIVNMICKPLPILKNTKVLSIKSNEELAIAQKIRLVK
ncbi:acetate/propionate family kinase [Candidatus Parcubacteria bacterium]|nr:acetate/propionate family kinase [Candidatus Parcubacteria bacterium]